ncbi:MAG: hypothetical protein RLZZ262_821 [Bacteroidota bacterium]|jgi:methylated-DNA-[protein]-cysteine S-methyltransferase
MQAITYYSSPIGLIKLEAVEGQIIALRFADMLEDDACQEHLLGPLLQQLHLYFKGTPVHFTLSLQPKGTPFQQAVWNILATIPHGRTRSYEEVAIAMGDRKKIRAVANAISKNPLPILIPCHRVVGKHGDLTGYLGGIWRKQHLLDLEKSHIQPPLIPLLPPPIEHH